MLDIVEWVLPRSRRKPRCLTVPPAQRSVRLGVLAYEDRVVPSGLGEQLRAALSAAALAEQSANQSADAAHQGRVESGARSYFQTMVQGVRDYDATASGALDALIAGRDAAALATGSALGQLAAGVVDGAVPTGGGTSRTADGTARLTALTSAMGSARSGYVSAYTAAASQFASGYPGLVATWDGSYLAAAQAYTQSTDAAQAGYEAAVAASWDAVVSAVQAAADTHGQELDAATDTLWAAYDAYIDFIWNVVYPPEGDPAIDAAVEAATETYRGAVRQHYIDSQRADFRFYDALDQIAKTSSDTRTAAGVTEVNAIAAAATTYRKAIASADVSFINSFETSLVAAGTAMSAANGSAEGSAADAMGQFFTAGANDLAAAPDDPPAGGGQPPGGQQGAGGPVVDILKGQFVSPVMQHWAGAYRSAASASAALNQTGFQATQGFTDVLTGSSRGWADSYADSAGNYQTSQASAFSLFAGAYATDWLNVRVADRAVAAADLLNLPTSIFGTGTPPARGSGAAMAPFEAEMNWQGVFDMHHSFLITANTEAGRPPIWGTPRLPFDFLIAKLGVSNYTAAFINLGQQAAPEAIKAMGVSNFFYNPGAAWLQPPPANYNSAGIAGRVVQGAVVSTIAQNQGVQGVINGLRPMGQALLQDWDTLEPASQLRALAAVTVVGGAIVAHEVNPKAFNALLVGQVNGLVARQNITIPLSLPYSVTGSLNFNVKPDFNLGAAGSWMTNLTTTNWGQAVSGSGITTTVSLTLLNRNGQVVTAFLAPKFVYQYNQGNQTLDFKAIDLGIGFQP